MAAPDTSPYVLTDPDLSLPNARVLSAGTGVNLTKTSSNITVALTGRPLALANLNTNGLVCTYGVSHTLGVSGFGDSATVNWSGGTSAGTPWSAAVVADTVVQRIVSNTIIDETVGTPVTSSTLLLEAGAGMSIVLTNDAGRAKYTISNSGSGGGGAPTDATYVTVDDETAELPNSSRFSTLFDAAIDDATPWTPAQGGTGIPSYALGDLLYASNSTTLARLAVPALPGNYNLTWDALLQQLVWETQPDVPTDLTDIDFVTLTDQTATLPNSADFTTTMNAYVAAASPWLDSQGGTGVTSLGGPYRLLYSSLLGNQVANLPQPTNSGVLVQVPGSAPSFVQITPATPGYLHVNSSGVFTWDDLILPTGTVTSVGLTSTNSNNVIAGGPITTFGTIDLKISTPIQGDEDTVFFTYTNVPNNLGEHNFVFNPTGLSNINSFFSNNIVLGTSACDQAVSNTNNIVLGAGALASGTNIDSSIVLGLNALTLIADTTDLDRACVGGINAFQSLTANAAYLTSWGYATLQYVTGGAFKTTAIGGNIGTGSGLAAATFEYCAFLGNDILPSNTATNYSKITWLGYGTDIAPGVTDPTNSTAVGADALVYANNQVQLGKECGMSLDALTVVPDMVTEERIVVWLDGTDTGNAYNLLSCVGDTPYRTGTFQLLNSGFTCGTALLTAGVDPSVVVTTSAPINASYSQIQLTLSGGAGITHGAVRVGAIDGSGFTIYMSGTLSADIGVNWVVNLYN